MGITKERLYNLVKEAGMLSILQKISRRINIQLPKTKRKIDWKCTKAFFSSSIGPSSAIEINLVDREPEGIVKKEEYDEIRELIIKALLRAKDPESGENIVQDAFKREDIYHGPYVSEAPDIIFLTRKLEYLATDRIYGESLVSEPFRKGRGSHRMEGILIAYGPDIKNEGKNIEPARIIDLAPTILHMFGLKIPEDMDGKVLTNIFKPDSPVAKRPIKYQKITERMRIKEELWRIGKL